MIYSVNSLTQVMECNILLAMANREKADLDYRKITDERLKGKFTETSQEIEAELQGVNAQIAASQNTIAMLPDGKAKDEEQDKLTRLIYRKFTLENRKENYGTVALLQKEMDLERVNRELEEMDVFITAIQTKKTELGG